jgi:hypothetical protein
MATIVPSPLHPSEEVAYSLAGGDFKLAAGGSYETEDPVLISSAYVHPWLEVKAEPLPDFRLPELGHRLDPKDDVLSAAHGSQAFDPEAIAATEREKMAAWLAPTAIEAGLDQDKVVVEAGVAQTLAAEDKVVEAAETEEEKATKAVDKKGKN